MPVPIAELFISVSADVNAALAGLNAVNNASGRLASQFQAAAPAAVVLAAGATAIGAAFAASVNVAADFEHQMSGVKAVMSTTEITQFGDALTGLALQLGRDTAFSAREAAAGIEELIKAGIPAQSVLAGAGAAATNLAAATGITVAEAATIASQAINTFGLDAGNLTPVVDRLAAVANASAADISFLRFAMAATGGVAKGIGLSFEDTAVAIGAMSNRFATGADAGTSLKTFLNGLIPTTKADKAAFRELGFTTDETANAFFDAEGKIKSFAEIAGILRQGLGGLTELDRTSKILQIFGTDAERAAIALFDLGRGGIEEFAALTGSAGVAAQSAKTRMDNLKGAMSNLGSSFETAQITIGNLFLPTIREIAVRARTLVDAFSNLSPETQRLATFIVAGTGAFLGLISGFVLLGLVIPPLIVSFGALNAILFANPIGLIVLALSALVTAAVIAFNANEDFRNSVLSLWDAIQNRLWPAIQSTAAAIQEQLGPVFASLSEQFNTFVATVAPLVTDFFQTTLPSALATMGTQFESLGPLFNALGGFFGAMFNLINALAATGGTALQGLFENVLVPGFQLLAAALEPLQPVLDQVGAALGAMFAPFTTIGALLQPVTDFFNNLTVAINAAAIALANFQLPSFLQPGSGSVLGAGAAAGGTFQQTAFTPGAAGGGGPGSIIIAGDVNIGSEVDADNFLARMAALVGASVGRVNAPPDNSGNPVLTPVLS